jgi:4-hydroxy-tetrahydrodipicolinate synthase
MRETSSVRTTPRLRGVLAPVITPFTREFEPDLGLFVAHCRWLSRDVGLAIFGTNSEAASISVEERLSLTDALIEAGIPAARMMPGTGACAITEAAVLSRHAVQRGAAGVLMLPPFYFKGVSDDGLFAYYSEVIERVGDRRLAVYLYHIPQLTQVPISLALIERLLKRYPEVIAGAKDSSGDWNNSKAMIEAFAADGFDVFPASEMMLTKGLAIGAAGCISATANVNPRALNALYRAKDTGERTNLQAKADTIRQIFQATPMIPAMKSVMAEYTGRASWNVVRPPLTTMPAVAAKALLDQLAAVGFAMPDLPTEEPVDQAVQG